MSLGPPSAGGPIAREAMELDLRAKADWVWRETVRIHGIAPETRLASSLSCVEILVALYYGGVLAHDPAHPFWELRDRFVVSKGHGSIALYPILADRGFFPVRELERVCQPGSFLGSIPDPLIPGYETVNGSLGHGLGVALGMAYALRQKGSPSHVFVLVGDGELYAGANWEAIMLAAHHRMGNLTVIVDNNGRCMLDDCRNVIDLRPRTASFAGFGWHAEEVDGHEIAAVHAALARLKAMDDRPKVLVANTRKGKGVPILEADPMCHVRTLSFAEVQRLLGERS
jgi:transketolase